MNKTIFILLFFIPVVTFGKFPFYVGGEPTGEPDIHYYKFYNGIQMIEFDYLSAYHSRINYLEQAHPRASHWATELGPPHPNVYIFRNENGDIVKQYGDFDKSKLLSVQESLKKTKTHNSFGSQFGSGIYSNFYSLFPLLFNRRFIK